MQSSEAGAAGAGAAQGDQKEERRRKIRKFTMTMLDMMQKEPAMQAQMYPYLPENMRNPETITWMLSNEACRNQLEAVLSEQVITMMTCDLNKDSEMNMLRYTDI